MLGEAYCTAIQLTARIMSYNYRKLKFFVEDSDGLLRTNRNTATNFFIAEDDHESGEMTDLMDRLAHFSSFWGVVRGPDAACALKQQECAHLRLTWTSDTMAITSRTFFRDGYVDVLHGSAVSSIPIVGGLLTPFFQKKVRESLVVRDGRVVFRHLGYHWGLSVH